MTDPNPIENEADSAEAAEPPSRSGQRVGNAKDRNNGRWMRRFRLRFRLLDLMWLALITAILILWYKDHRYLTDQLASINTSQSWSVKQILGKPDTPTAGDRPTAWAAAGQDSGIEWLIVEFPRAVTATKLQIEETYNPGAVMRVCSVDFKRHEQEIWKGKDPTPPSSMMGTSIIPFKDPISSRRFKIYLDSAAVPGWNEIDAVALHGDDGSVQWASDAWASSCFGGNQTLPTLFWP